MPRGKWLVRRLICRPDEHSGRIRDPAPALRPDGDRAQVAAGLARREDLGGPQPARRAAQAPTCSRCCPTRPASRTSATSRSTRSATRSRTSAAATASACCTRWATTPSACRPRTTRSRPASTRASRPNAAIAEFRRQFRDVGHLDRLVARVRHPRARVLPLDAVDLPAALRARPRLPQGGGRQVVPERPDRARQRAGHRRALRALRHRGRGQAARAVVLQDHRLRRPAARRLRHARAGPSTSITMQRNWIGRSEGAEVVFRCEELGIDYPGLHDAPRHALRRDLLRDGARAPRRRAAGRRHRARGRRCASTSTPPLAESTEERGADDKEKTGVAARPHVVNPVNGEEIPMFVADYVLMEYGTGAIMAVPGARPARLRVRRRSSASPIRQVIAPATTPTATPTDAAVRRRDRSDVLVNSRPSSTA